MTQLTAAQCRAARALANWSQDQLATASRVAKATIANFELGKREPYERTLNDLFKAFEGVGLEFTNHGHPGVRVKWPVLWSLKVLGEYVHLHSDIAASHGAKLQSPATGASRKREIEDLSSKILELADRSQSRKVRYRDFEVLLDQLHRLGAFPTNDQVSAVAQAFHDAEAKS